MAPGARVRPSTNHWVSYQPTALGLGLRFFFWRFPQCHVKNYPQERNKAFFQGLLRETNG